MTNYERLQTATDIRLTDAEREHCKRHGVSEAAYLAVKMEEAGQLGSIMIPVELSSRPSGKRTTLTPAEIEHCKENEVSEESYLAAINGEI